MKTIKRYCKAGNGYGERWAINSKDMELYNFFKLICLWTQDAKVEEDWSCTLIFELPLGITYDDCASIRLAIERLGYKVED